MIYKKTWKYILKYLHNSFYRPRAVKNFSNIPKGDVGGYVRGYHNLSQKGNCWISDNSMVFGNAKVSGNAQVYEHAKVYNNAHISGNAHVYDYAEIGGNTHICGDTRVKNRKIISE